MKANQDAQAELIKAIYDGAPGSNAEGNLDKYFTDKITNDAKVKNATALGDATVTPVKEVTKEMDTDLPKAIQDLKDLVGTDNATGTDRKAETLAANKDKHLQTIADLKCARDSRSAPFANQKVTPLWVTGAKLANYFFSPYCFCNF